MFKELVFTFTLVAMMATSPSLYGQSSTDFDGKLLAKFSQEELNEFSPNELAYWTYFVSEGFEVFTITKDQLQSEIKSLDFIGEVSNFNPLALNITPEETAVVTYRIGNTDQGIMILSKQKILAKMGRKQ